MHSEICGFHRVEIPALSEGSAPDAFHSLSNLDRSPAVGGLTARMDFRLLSIGLLASSVCRVDCGEGMLLKRGRMAVRARWRKAIIEP